MKLKKYISILSLFSLATLNSIGQTSTFTGEPGQWVGPANWNNGVPSASVNAIINGRCRITSGGGACLNLNILTGKRFRFTGGNTIIVNGILDISSSAILEFEGGFLNVLDDVRLDGNNIIEINGGLTFSSGFNIGQ